MKPQSKIKGIKRGRHFDSESPSKKNILDGKAEDMDYILLPTCLKNATPPEDAACTNLGSGWIGGHHYLLPQ